MREQIKMLRTHFRVPSLMLLLAAQAFLIFGLGPLLSLGFSIPFGLAATVFIIVVIVVVIASSEL